MKKNKPKTDNHSGSILCYEIYHEENPYNAPLKKLVNSKSKQKPKKKAR